MIDIKIEVPRQICAVIWKNFRILETIFNTRSENSWQRHQLKTPSDFIFTVLTHSGTLFGIFINQLFDSDLEISHVIAKILPMYDSYHMTHHMSQNAVSNLSQLNGFKTVTVNTFRLFSV